MSRRIQAVLAIAAIIVGFGYAMVHLFVLRFDTGEMYPPYSSFRADPVGMKALYESLGSMPGITVARNLESPARMPSDPDGMLVCAGLRTYGDIDAVEAELVEAFERFAQAGGRVVLAFLPNPEAPEPVGLGGTPESVKELVEDTREEVRKKKQEKADKEAPPEDKEAAEGPIPEEKGADPGDGSETDEARADVPPTQEAAEKEEAEKGEGVAGEGEKEEDESDFAEIPLVSLKKRWGITCAYTDLWLDENGNWEPEQVTLEADERLPEHVSWWTALYFKEPDPSWRTIYRRVEGPVFLERTFGKGSIVLSADSHYMTNEAMVRERHPDLLAWLVGAKKHVVFDESLKGVQQSSGAMTLARRYGVHGFLVGLGVLLALFVWRNAATLTPRFSDAEVVHNRAAFQGRDAAEGLENLLRRSINGNSLLGICVQEWKRAFAAGRPNLQKTVARMEALVEAQGVGQNNALSGYQAIVQTVARRRAPLEERRNKKQLGTE